MKTRGARAWGWDPARAETGRGRPDFAEASGRQPEKIDEMLQASEGVVGELLART